MSLGGLRNSEALHATWAMLSPGESGTWLLHLYAHGAYKPKAASRTIILAATVVEALRAVRRDQAPEAHLVTAHHATARHTACYRSISTLLRRAGIAPVKGKLAYRLRAHAITQIILNHGMDAAQQFAGHTTAKTTAIYKGASIPYQPLPL
jgi:integrase